MGDQNIEKLHNDHGLKTRQERNNFKELMNDLRKFMMFIK